MKDSKDEKELAAATVLTLLEAYFMGGLRPALPDEVLLRSLEDVLVGKSVKCLMRNRAKLLLEPLAGLCLRKMDFCSSCFGGLRPFLRVYSLPSFEIGQIVES